MASGPTFVAVLRLRLAAAGLVDELLGALATHGRMSGEELRDFSDAKRAREDSSAPPGARGSQAAGIRERITPGLESRRRVGLVVGEAGAVTATGIPVVEPEWRLTDAGVAYLQTRSEEKRLVPRVVLNRLGAVAVDGLTTAMKTAIAAFPALVLAWMVGLIRDPSPIGFSAAAALFAGVAGLALARARAVSLANAPALREVLRAGGEFAQELEASNRNWARTSSTPCGGRARIASPRTVAGRMGCVDGEIGSVGSGLCRTGIRPIRLRAARGR